MGERLTIQNTLDKYNFITLICFDTGEKPQSIRRARRETFEIRETIESRYHVSSDRPLVKGAMSGELV